MTASPGAHTHFEVALSQTRPRLSLQLFVNRGLHALLWFAFGTFDVIKYLSFLQQHGVKFMDSFLITTRETVIVPISVLVFTFALVVVAS